MSTDRVTAETGVREASERFYDALERMANGDATSMADIWSHSDDVTTMHPIGGREVGWNEVEGPWGAVADLSSDGEITISDQILRVEGNLAYELVNEHVHLTLGGEALESENRATNVYRREGNEWKIVHHHVDADQGMIEILERLEAGA